MPGKEPIVKRYKRNPILTKDDVPYPVATVHNAGVIKHNGRYIMLFRSHLHNGRSVIGRADSDDGLSFTVNPEPVLLPSHNGIFAEYEEFGVEDLRINPVEEEYLLTYSAYSRHGVRIALARTKDFKSIERVALITQADLRNVVIFPERFQDRYTRLDRPHSEISPWSIWISYSPDLVHWGNSKVIMKPVSYHWDEMKIGPGAPPFKTGTDQWILQPEDPWEINGYVPNVVFTCGAVPEDDGTVKIYWGGADTVMCAGTAHIDDLVQLCLTNARSPL
jgi:predicted GH43/DUF377 family glycosyl hydrolase